MQRGFVSLFVVITVAALVGSLEAASADTAVLSLRSSERFPLIELPARFEIEKVVDGLTYPTSIAWDDEGRTYVAEAGGQFLPEPVPARILRIENGRAIPLIDLSSTGVADSVVGLQWYQGAFYFTHRDPEDFSGAVSSVTLDGTHTLLFTGIKDSQSEHQVNDIRLGPDGWMYVASGLATNSGVVDLSEGAFIEISPELKARPCRDYILNGFNFETPDFRTETLADTVLTGAFVPFGTATEPGQRIEGVRKCGGAILVFDPANPEATLRPFADGFRNIVGFAWDTNGRMFAAVNGLDVRGSRPIDDEFDATYVVREDTWYGHPDFSAALQPVTRPKFDVPDSLQAPVFRGLERLVTKRPRFLIDHEASGLARPDESLVAGLHEKQSSPSKLDVAPDSWGRFGGQVFVAEFGDLAPATNPLLDKPTGFQVSRIAPGHERAIPFIQNNKPGPASALGKPGKGLERPFDVKFGPDGAMYIVDFGVAVVNEAMVPPYEFPPATGVIWKVTPTRP